MHIDFIKNSKSKRLKNTIIQFNKMKKNQQKKNFYRNPVNSFIIIVMLFLSQLSFGQLSATNATRNIPAGSVIINMGVTPQTINNGMRPYGLVYDLVVNKKIPVIWAISPTKAKDGIDFSVDGIDFRGSAFIIEKKWVSLPSVQASFANANFSVVTKHTTTTAVNVPFYKELKAFTKWTFDTDNGNLTDEYLGRASIPLTARQTALPSALTPCHDVFVLPHADPKWATHGKLYEWVREYNPTTNPNGNSGWLWSGCHAPNDKDGIENMYNSANSSQRTNFLTNANGNSASLGKQAPSGTATNWQYSYPNDSPMQFMGNMGTVLNNGSGPGYIPTSSSTWRPGAKVGIVDPSQGANKIAYELIYGYAYDNLNNGVVMYEAGHSFDGTSAANVSAMRAFLNFVFDGSSNKLPQFTEVIAQPSEGIIIQSGQTLNLNTTATGYAGVTTTYQWTQQGLNGTFSSTNTSATVYTAETLPTGSTDKSGTITLTATDPCGRPNVFTYPVTIKAPAFCTKPGLTGTPNGYTKVGILTKGSITNSTGSVKWPENVPNGHLVMDSENKGFVITHMTTLERDALTPLKGMLIYNTDDKCVQLYRGTAPTIDNTRTGWNCIERGCNE